MKMKTKIKAALLLIACFFSSGVLADSYKFRSYIYGLFGPGSSDSSGVSKNASDIDCGQLHCYALVEGRVWSVGKNEKGQLGLGHNEDRLTWQPTDLEGVSGIAAGHTFGYAIKDGVVYVVGENSKNQLGIAVRQNLNTWTSSNISGVSAVAAGQYHGYALKDGSVYVTGNNVYGQLGLGKKDTSTTRVWTDTGLRDIVTINSGYNSGYAINSNQYLYVAGENGSGQLGLGNKTDSERWRLSTTGVTAVAGGQFEAYMIKSNQVYSTGANYYGQLGMGNNTNVVSWTPTGLHGVNLVAANAVNGYAVKDGTVYATGINSSGQLGFGPSVSQNKFKATTLTDVSKITAGYYFLIALSNGNLYSVGNDGYVNPGTGDEINGGGWREIIDPFKISE